MGRQRGLTRACSAPCELTKAGHMNEPETYTNPILPGDFPDPSIVRVDDDYYLVNSTFRWFPGISVSHSRDLVNWALVGHVLTRRSQLGLHGMEDWAGIWAPDISYHDGRFWVVYTVQTPSAGLNCLVHAERPEGPYSDPVVLNDRNIDPSIFRDDDGRRYLATSRGHLQELAADGSRLLGKAQVVWPGMGGHAPEAPHILKRRGYYYLMMAEGGTGYGHSEVLARARELRGPYEPCPYNPILKQADADHPIQKAGHGKPVLTQHGEWWFVYLCGRPYGGTHCNLGRETALGRMHWTDDDWFTIAAPEVENVRPRLPWTPMDAPGGNAFASPRALRAWQFMGNPPPDCWSVANGVLNLAGAVFARRQQHTQFRATTAVAPEHTQRGKQAGLVVYHDTCNHAKLRADAADAVLTVVNKGESTTHRQPLAGPGTFLRVTAHGQRLRFQAGGDGESWTDVGPVVGFRFMSPEAVREQPGRKSFVGNRIGVYDESAAGDPTSFRSFVYEQLSEDAMAPELASG
jgi:xylan 1,4-beta-xylosidase